MQVALDSYPADVTTPNGYHEKVRVVVAGGQAVVFSVQGSSPIVEARAATADTVTLTTGWPYRIQTDEGPWTVSRSQGCGCGSLLKAVNVDHLLAAAGVHD